jgi:hypothetical protein
MKNFKAANGRYYTRQLFWEESIELANAEKSIEPVFTLYGDKPGLINFGKRYVELEDPTGYEVAIDLLGDYRLWTVLMQCKWFQTAKKQWDAELDAKLTVRAFKKIKELSKDGPPPQQLAASKYLANLEYRKDHKATKGRPTRTQVEQAAREEADNRTALEEDYQRIRLVKPVA